MCTYKYIWKEEEEEEEEESRWIVFGERPIEWSAQMTVCNVMEKYEPSFSVDINTERKERGAK
jgi:hypothetical protein